MKYAEIIDCFDRGKVGLDELLEKNTDIFNQIEEYGQQLLQGIISTSNDYKMVLNFMTGAYVALEPIYSVAKAQKLNNELGAYVNQKREMESQGAKVVASHLEKESSLSVVDERRVRNILEGYVLATEKAIITCQTQLKRIEQDGKYKPESETNG